MPRCPFLLAAVAMLSAAACPAAAAVATATLSVSAVVADRCTLRATGPRREAVACVRMPAPFRVAPSRDVATGRVIARTVYF